LLNNKIKINFNMKKIYSILLIIGIFALQSCDKVTLPDVTGTKVQKMCGEWYIEVKDNSGALAAPGYHLIRTSNTAANTDNELLMDDLGLWPFKVKCPVTIGNQTFNPAVKLANFARDTIKVSIKSGVIINGAATSSGGNKTDSISVKFEFTDDPGTEYNYSGYRRTGFLEDEH
jgi:Lipid-binding putative hydrolase